MLLGGALFLDRGALLEPVIRLQVLIVRLVVLPSYSGWIKMRPLAVFPLLALAVGLGRPAATAAQEVSDFLPVGEIAPDIQVTGATRYGVVSQPLRLTDFRGETVVLAFFFRARSGG